MSRQTGTFQLTGAAAFWIVALLWVIALLSNLWVAAIITALCAVRYPGHTARILEGVAAFLKQIPEPIAFILVVGLWLFAIFANLWLAAIIATLAALRYSAHFSELIRRGLANQWPYNTVGVIGIILAFFLFPMASILANGAISNITGFHPTFFPNSFIFLFTVTYVFLLSVLLAVLSGTIAILRPSNPKTNRAFPVAFGLAVVVLVAATGSFPNTQTIVDRAENAILALDFGSNARFESGFYVSPDGKRRMYGTKVCVGLPFHALLAPHAQEGFILANRRLKAARNDFASHGVHKPVEATRFVYTFVKQDDCPDIQTYYEYFENRVLRMRSQSYRKRRSQ